MIAKLKKAFLMVAGAAVQKFGAELEDHQQLLMAAADMLIEIYMAESAVLRTEKMAKKLGTDKVSDQLAMTQLYLYNAVDIVTQKGKEGIVISYNNGQNRIKLKSDWYNWLHRIKSQLSSTKNLIDHYIEKEMPSIEEFYKIIETEFDYEIAVQLKQEIEKICEAGEKAKKYIDHILEVVHDIRTVETRKEQALMIKRNFQENSSFVFCVLDNKEITKEQWTKLINQNYES
jgi:NADH:ubiquinone oxidoreductase subunit